MIVHRLGAADGELLFKLNRMFAHAFDDFETYTARAPSTEYVSRLLGREEFVALAAVEEDEVVGGLVGYELPKFG